MAGSPRDRLMRTATAYLSRRAGSTARLRAVLERAAARWVRAGEEAPDREEIEDVLARLAQAGLLDDAAFARMKARSLAAKGYSAFAIRAGLRARYGVEADGDAAADIEALDPLAQATRWAERRRLGPFRSRDRARKRDTDIASLVRAGFPVDIARTVIGRPAEDDEDGFPRGNGPEPEE